MAINSVLQSLKLLNPLFFCSSRIPFYNCLREADFLRNPAVRLFHDCSHSKDQEQRLMKQTLEEKHSMECELEVVEYLDSLKNYEKVGVPEGAGTDSDKGFDLQRMHRLLARLGDPLSKFQVVHVAGTKGKGSTVAFISNILRAAGFSVGTYTSPHISSIRERIVAGKSGSPISAEALRDLLRAARGILDCAILKESGRLSHFEVLTALAFKHFAEEKVDFAVVEAGLGGARDATNVVQPNGLAAAVIVAIGEEHLEALGGSLESIALAKAGIIKYGCPVVLGHQSEPIAEAVVQKVAASKRAHVFTTSSKDVQSSLNGYYIEKGMPFQMCSFIIDSKIEGLRVDLPNCKLRMVGPHQLDNATTAILTALCLQRKGWQIRDTAIQRGLECTFLPGRFQLTTSVEAHALGSCDAQVILDGAHTTGSAIMLAKTIKSFFQDVPLALVVAMASDKDHSAFASAMLSEGKPAIIVTTEVSVAGSRLRSASKSFLLRTWTEAAKRHEMAISHHSEFLPKRGCKEDASLYDSGTDVERRDQEKQISTEALRADKYGKASLVLEEANSLLGAVKLASERLQLFRNLGQGIICVTGSLHAVSAANSIISDCAKHCC